MSTTVRWIRVGTLVSMLAMLAMPTLAAAQSASNDATSTTTGDEFCLYPGKKTDTPETGPMPCDTSRPYMIGHSSLGGGRISSDSEHNVGPKSHLNPDGSVPSAAEAVDHTDGTSASPSSSDANSGRTPDVEAP
jgi:hypothetical protein